MKELEKILKALADKNRLRILNLLRQKKMCVCELAYVLGITQPSISRHLKKLKTAKLIQDEQEGFWTNYFLSKEKNIYASKFKACIHSQLNKNSVIKNDLEKAKKIDRTKLCCKK